jgi:hypothetical protein
MGNESYIIFFKNGSKILSGEKIVNTDVEYIYDTFFGTWEKLGKNGLEPASYRYGKTTGSI